MSHYELVVISGRHKVTRWASQLLLIRTGADRPTQPVPSAHPNALPYPGATLTYVSEPPSTEESPTMLIDLLRYAIGSWPRTWRLLTCLTPVLLVQALVQLSVR